MDNQQGNSAILDGADILISQKKFEAGQAKKRVFVGWGFLVVSILSLISTFVLPLYKYSLETSVSNDYEVIGKFSIIQIISKFFNNEMGPVKLLNTLSVITAILLIVSGVIIVATSVISILFKSVAKSSKFMSVVTNFENIELVVVIQFIVLLANMILTKVDVNGNASNGLGYWVLFASGILLTCASITLSSKSNS